MEAGPDRTIAARRGRAAMLLGLGALLAACSPAPPQGTPTSIAARSRPLPPSIPDSGGFGVHVLALAEDTSGRLWAGTFGHGIYVLDRQAAREAARRGRGREPADSAAPPPAPGTPWRRIAVDSDSIAWDVVNSIAFTRKGDVWYGTVGNGFGKSTDTGATWRNWTMRELGPRWQYVAPNGIRTHADTVFIATADGLRITRDGGERWTCVVASGGSGTDAGCAEQVTGLPNEYLLALDVDVHGRVWAGSLGGLALSPDGGRTWRTLGEAEGLPRERIRAVVMNTDSTVWVATEAKVYVDSTRREDRFAFKEAQVRVPGFGSLPGGVRAMAASPGRLPPILALSYGMAVGDTETGSFRLYYLAAADAYRPAGDLWTATWWGPPIWPLAGATTGLNLTLAGDYRPDGALTASRVLETAEPRHAWFQRPIDGADGNPYIDATYRYGSTMGGRFQQHQGVEFNNPAGTPVRAIGDGIVVYAGTAEAGSNTVAIRHDRQFDGRFVFSTYYHNTSIDVAVGDEVRTGQILARVGNTGRATNNHLHLEVHVAAAENATVVDPNERFPATTVNPQLWLQPLPGTGMVAGRVLDAAGQPVRGARIHGLVVTYPAETPFSYAETYGDRGNPDPAYGENFAVGDVPAGDYLLGVDIGGQRVWRRIRVQPGRLTWVEFRPS